MDSSDCVGSVGNRQPDVVGLAAIAPALFAVSFRTVYPSWHSTSLPGLFLM